MSEHNTNKAGLILNILAWLLLMAMLGYFWHIKFNHMENPNQEVQIDSDTQNLRQVTLKMNNYNHYVFTGTINNEPVTFLLDTGASSVAIPSHIADKLKLKRGQEVPISTASGDDIAYRTKIDSLSIGNIVVHDIKGLILSKASDDEVLLGMSVLKKLEFTQSGRNLIIKQKKRG